MLFWKSDEVLKKKKNKEVETYFLRIFVCKFRFESCCFNF